MAEAVIAGSSCQRERWIFRGMPEFPPAGEKPEKATSEKP
jgi:hypothetical protein